MKSFTKKELARELAASNDISIRLATDMVNSTFGAITDKMNAGEVVSVDKIGKFHVQTRPARMGRNPQDGTILEVPEKKLAKFKISNVLKTKIQEAYVAAA